MINVELGWLDSAVLVALLALSVAIGFLSARKNQSTEGYLLGSRSLPWWAILGSIVATETSTATVLSIPGAAYGETGMRWLQLAFGFILGRIIVVRLLLPLYFRGKILTAYEVLDQRFGGPTRLSASALFLITRNLGDGLRLFLAGVVLHELLGWSLPSCIILMGVVTMIYTWFGGLRSVVWNDCVQWLIYMFGGVCAVFILVNAIPGGWGETWRFASETGKAFPLNWHWDIHDPYTLWAGMIGGAFLSIGTHGTDHMMVQRYLSARSQTEAGRAVLLSGLVVFFQFALFLWIGIQLACYYHLHPADAPEKADQAFAQFIVQNFPANTGLIGLMMAAILAAAMSTLSSSLSASASALMSDFYLPLHRKLPSDRHQLLVSKIMTVGFGILQVAIGIWASQLERTVISNALAIAGFAAGLLLGVFALGVFSKCRREIAVLGGAMTGLVVLVIIQFVWVGEDGSPRVAWPWLALIGSTTTYSAGRFLNLFFKNIESNELSHG